MAKVPVAEQVQVNFRMPADLRDRIKVAAEKHGQSMNAEIVETLERRYPAPRTAEDVFEDVLMYLSTVEDDLRPSAIEFLLRQKAERINRLASAYSLGWKDD